MIVERETQIREIAIIFRGVRQMLGVTNDVVACIADRSARDPEDLKFNIIRTGVYQ